MRRGRIAELARRMRPRRTRHRAFTRDVCGITAFKSLLSSEARGRSEVTFERSERTSHSSEARLRAARRTILRTKSDNLLPLNTIPTLSDRLTLRWLSLRSSCSLRSGAALALIWDGTWGFLVTSERCCFHFGTSNLWTPDEPKRAGSRSGNEHCKPFDVWTRNFWTWDVL